MKIKKSALFTVAMLFLLFLINNKPIYAAEIIYLPHQNSSMNIELRGDQIEWRYQIVNGKMYRRLYNYTRQTWIGEWEVS